MRYFICVGDDPDTALILAGPLGGPVVYHDHHEACEAAREIVRGHTVRGAFVMKFTPTAFYLPVVGPRQEGVIVDETILSNEGGTPASEEN